MNYIKHLNAVFHAFYSDTRLNNGHISLYMALFFYWNLHQFAAEFYANRTEVMKMAKIGSRSTYHRLIKDLCHWEYIEYLPAQNPSQMTMIRMSQICTDTSTDLGLNGTLMQQYCPKSVPLTLYNKHINKFKKVIKSKPKNEMEAIAFFASKKWATTEALKFFNHYQGIGWKVGGKTPMEDWTAIAENWMLKAQEIKNATAQRAIAKNEDFLKTSDQKNYGQPL